MSAGATPISAAVAGELAAPVELKPAGVVRVDIVSAEIVPAEVVLAEVVNAEIVPADTVAAEVVNAELVPAVISAEIAPAEIVPAEFLSAVVVPAVATDAEIVPALVPAAGVGQGLTAPAANTIVAELRLPDLEPVLLEPAASEPREAVLRDVVARTSVPEASVSDFDQLLTGLGGPTTSAEIPLPTRASLRGNRTAADSTADAPLTEPGERDLFTSPEIPLAPAGTDSASSWADDAKQSSNSQPPRKPFVPTTSARVPTQPAAAKSGATKKGARRLAAKGVTLAAMSFALLMAVATSLPAEALLSSSDVEAAAHEALQPVDSEPAQSLDIAGGTDTISVQRDGYESKSIAEVAAASGIRLEGTFTNNPNGTIQWPFAVGVHIGDHFGFRDCSGCSSDHGGQDFNPGLGAPIQAISDGVVSLADDGEGSLGVHMIIDHMIDGKPVSSVYAHMQHGSMKFKTGDVVKVGQVIGSTGTTGMSTGPHLHFEIRIGGKAGNKVDPLEWLYANVN